MKTALSVRCYQVPMWCQLLDRCPSMAGRSTAVSNVFLGFRVTRCQFIVTAEECHW